MAVNIILIREQHWTQTDKLLKVINAKEIIRILNLPPTYPTTIECTTCNQQPDTHCQTRTGKPAHQPHQQRTRAAIAAVFAHADTITIQEQPTYHDLQSDEVANAKI